MTPYYIITRITDSASTSQTGAITEPELHRRIDAVINLRVKDGGADWSWEEAENIILNGGER